MFFAPAIWLHTSYSITITSSVSLELHRQFGAATLVAGASLHSALWGRSIKTLSLVSWFRPAWCDMSGNQEEHVHNLLRLVYFTGNVGATYRRTAI